MIRMTGLDDGDNLIHRLEIRSLDGDPEPRVILVNRDEHDGAVSVFKKAVDWVRGLSDKDVDFPESISGRWEPDSNPQVGGTGESCWVRRTHGLRVNATQNLFLDTDGDKPIRFRRQWEPL